MYTYRTNGTCSREINYNVIDGRVYDVNFLGGCKGNLQAVAKLVDGRTIKEVIGALSGIQCRGGTSCPDQLAKALSKHINSAI